MRQRLHQLLQSANRLWVIGRRSERAYLRFYPNPGFMIPIWPGKRLRGSKFYGFQITKPPTPQDPTGVGRRLGAPRGSRG